MKKTELTPLLSKLATIEPGQNQELEILKFWFLDFLSSVEGVLNISANYYQNPWGFYQFTFEFHGVSFKAATNGKDQVMIRDRNQDYFLSCHGDSQANYFKLASAMFFGLKQAGKI